MIEMFLGTAQPTTCTRCDVTTEIIKDITVFQKHIYLNRECNFKFILEVDTI